MKILALDPGNEVSGLVELTGRANIDYCAVIDNQDLLERLTISDGDVLVSEYMEPRGMPTSKQEMRTLWWIGRFRERWGNRGWYQEVTRRAVKMHICGHMKATDANIRRALIDRYPPVGGGKEPAIGVKANPGPLYGMSSHMWPALAVGITYLETMCREAA